MSHASIHIGDTLHFVSTFVDEDGDVVNISSATTKEFHFKKPDGTTTTEAGAFVTDGTDGKIDYTATINDLDQDGAWEHQGYIVMPTGTYHSKVLSFVVKDNLI
jgi:hypothetical protein